MPLVLCYEICLSGDGRGDDRKPSGKLFGRWAVQSGGWRPELLGCQARGGRHCSLLLVNRVRPAAPDRRPLRDNRRSYPGDSPAAQRKGLARSDRLDGCLCIAFDRDAAAGRLGISEAARRCDMARLCAEAPRPTLARYLSGGRHGEHICRPCCFSARYDRKVASIVKPCRTMKFAAILFIMAGAALGGCSTLPTAGPTTGQVVDQAVKDDQARFDVVDVDNNVVSTLLAQPAESFRNRFRQYGKPPAPTIGIGDAVVVTIWEAAGGGLFGGGTTIGVTTGSRSVTIPEQVVSRDGAISVPFADRIPVAGQSLLEVPAHDRATSCRQSDRAADARRCHQERHQLSHRIGGSRQRRQSSALGQWRPSPRFDCPRGRSEVPGL